MSMRCDDFVVRADAVVRFSPPVRCRRRILATGVRRESRAIMMHGNGVSPTALCGRSAEALGDDLPVVAVDAGGGQMQHDAPHRGLDPGAELHQMFAQGADLGGSEGGTRGAQAQLLVEHIGGGAQQPRSWLARKRVQLVRSISKPWCNSLIRFSMLARAQ